MLQKSKNKYILQIFYKFFIVLILVSITVLSYFLDFKNSIKAEASSITSVSPNNGPTTGGTNISMAGSGFANLYPGGLDPNFNSGGTSATHSTYAFAAYNIMVIKPLPNNKILIGGYFRGYNGVTRNLIAQLNADGTLDTPITKLLKT